MLKFNQISGAATAGPQRLAANFVSEGGREPKRAVVDAHSPLVKVAVLSERDSQRSYRAQRVEKTLQDRVIKLEMGRIGDRVKGSYRVGDIFTHVLRIQDSSELPFVSKHQVHSYLTKGQAFDFNAIMRGIAQEKARIDAKTGLSAQDRVEQLLAARIRFDHYDIGRVFPLERSISDVLTRLGVDHVNAIPDVRADRFADVHVGDLIDLPAFIQRIEAKKARIEEALNQPSAMGF